MREILPVFTLIVPGEDERALRFDETNIHQLFSVVEHEEIDEPVELYRGKDRIAILHRTESGLWELNRSSVLRRTKTSAQDPAPATEPAPRPLAAQAI